MSALALTLPTAEVPLTPENVRPGYLALFIVLVLVLAVFLLIRSFLKHARKADAFWEGERPEHAKPVAKDEPGAPSER